MNFAKATLHTAIFTILFQLAYTDFDCEEKEVTGTCTKELQCLYEEAYQERKGYSRYCRCKMVIHSLPLPENTLTYSAFKKICYERETELQQLWVVDAELEYIDNEIFKKYPNLKYVNLTKNNLILNFTEEAAGLTELDVSHNGLNVIQGQAFQSLKSLKTIKISFNRLDEVNFCFKKLENLEEIYLNNNQLTKILDDEFGHLQKLRVLDLAHNFLTVIESNLLLSNLQELYLNNNKLSSINQQEFVRLPNLRILKIGDNFFTKLASRYNIDNIEELHCENNQIMDVNKDVINKLQKLKFVNFSNNQVENLEAKTFSSDGRIQVVDISSNKLTTVDPNNFQNFKNVSILNFNNNSLSEKVISCDNLQNLKQVNVLLLSYNKISEIYNCTFAKLENLSKLSLLANQLERIPPSAFSALTKLQELNLAQNQITDFQKGTFDNLKELRSLNVSNNNLTEFDLNRLNNNQKIMSFDIKHNRLKKLDLNRLKNKLPAAKILDFDTNLVKCEEYADVLEYFEENSVTFAGCESRIECCVDVSINKNLIIIVIASVIICLLALIGLFTILNRCCRSDSNTVQLIQIHKNL